MKPIKRKPFRWSLILSGFLAGCLLQAPLAHAQDSDEGSDSGIQTGETTSIPRPDQAKPDQLLDPHEDTPDDNAPPSELKPEDLKQQGPVRMARFSYVSGNVTWRPDSSGEWSKATVNLPIRQGTQIAVVHGGRADVQFDDGSELRMGSGAVVELKLLYSDAQGEFTQLTLKDGLATLRARHDVSVYQIDTPLASVKTKGPSQVRFGVDSGSEIVVQEGSATTEGKQGKITLKSGDYLSLNDETTPYKVAAAPGPDTWDKWNADRNRELDGGKNTARNVPSNIGLVAGDLDAYGTWHNDPKYGAVWAPTVTSPDWRPYYDGRWTWTEPYGWTWVSNEPWGWAPYHYGTWISEPYGWAWVPGPAYQYWSPAVVDFSVYNGGVCWAPLCPWEVAYPAAFGIGYWGSGWGLSFSIGLAGCYYPGGFGFGFGFGFGGYGCFSGRPFNNYYVNHFGEHGYDHGYGHDFGHYANFNHNGEFGGNHYVPYNASHAGGASFAGNQAFGGQGAYKAIPRGQTAAFSQGHAVGAPAAGRAPASGPASVQPSRESMTPTRSFASVARPSQAALQRSTYHAALPASVQRNVGTVARNTGFGSVGTARTQSAANSARTAAEGRTSMGSSFTRGAGSGYSAAEAARQARASLGMTGRGAGSGFAGNSGHFGGSSSYGGSVRGSYNSAGRSYSGSSYSGGRYGGYSGGSSGHYSGGRSGGYSGGGYSGGRGYSGGGFGGGGHSGGGGSGGHR